jgi:hypothetical protein
MPSALTFASASTVGQSALCYSLTGDECNHESTRETRFQRFCVHGKSS